MSPSNTATSMGAAADLVAFAGTDASDHFDYEQLDDAAALEAKAVVERYRGRVQAYVIETGRDLLAVKARLDHGLFVRWVEAELRITARTAQRFMGVAQVLGAKSDTVSCLPPATLYQLAAPTTPEPVRDEIVGRLEAGEQITPLDIQYRLREAKREIAQAKISPEERKRQAKAKRASDARRRREHEKWQQEQAESTARKVAATQALAEILASKLDEESLDAVYKLFGECDTWRLRVAIAQARQL